MSGMADIIAKRRSGKTNAGIKKKNYFLSSSSSSFNFTSIASDTILAWDIPVSLDTSFSLSSNSLSNVNDCRCFI